MPRAGGYIATFRTEGARPRPDAIRACRLRQPVANGGAHK
jgi:hypothetical protein